MSKAKKIKKAAAPKRTLAKASAPQPSSRIKASVPPEAMELVDDGDDHRVGDRSATYLSEQISNGFRKRASVKPPPQ